MGLVLAHVAVLDGSGAPPARDQVVVVRDGRIADVGAAGQVRIPLGSRVIDLTGCVVTPGFVDLHVHLHEAPEVYEPMLARLLEHGVTTILCPGTRRGAGVELRDRVRAGEVEGPRLLVSGPAINGGGDDRGASAGPGGVRVRSVEETAAEVRRQVAEGVDWIKLYRDLPPDLAAAAVRAARAASVPVCMHAGRTTWTEAASLGVDMLVHSGWGTPMDEVVAHDDPASASDRDWYAGYRRAVEGERFGRLAGHLSRTRVAVVPTLAITRASSLGRDARLLGEHRTDLAPDADAPGWWGAGWRERHPQFLPDSDEEARLLYDIVWPAALSITRAYYEQGVRLGVGTDVGNAWITPGWSYHLELALLQEAGLPPLEVLRLATSAGAEALGLGQETGRIAVGLRADLVVLREDPSADVRAARSIEAVFMDGRCVHSAREELVDARPSRR